MCWFFPSKKGFCNVKIGFPPNVSLNHTMKHLFAGMAIVKPHKFSGFLKMNYKIANKSTCLTRNWYWASCNDAATPFFTLRYLPKRAIFRIISAVLQKIWFITLFSQWYPFNLIHEIYIHFISSYYTCIDHFSSERQNFI